MVRATTQRTVAVVLGLVLACCPCVIAKAPSLDASQYSHTVWRADEGLLKGTIFSIAQTSDGYLWLGTEFGLLRFDGVRATAWQPPTGERLPSNDVKALRVARDGRLWIGTSLGLASWKDGQLTHYSELDGTTIEVIVQDHEGTVWVGASAPPVGRLCSFNGTKTQCSGEDGRFGAGVTALYEDSAGNLWAGGTTGLWRLKHGPPKLYSVPDPALRINALIEDDGALLIAKRSGIQRLRNGKAEMYPPVAGLQQFKSYIFLRDRKGDLWIGASVDSGLVHVHDGRADLFTVSDGLSGDSVTSLLEDREGNVWVATAGGLDRFREPTVLTISVKQGLSSRALSSILAAKDGSILLGTSDGLNRWNNGRLTIYGKRSGGSGLEKPTSSTDKWTSSPASTVREITGTGLPEDEVYSMFEDKQGRIFVATARGFGVLESERFTPVSSLPGGFVYSITSDNAGNIWISHTDGLFRLRGTTVVERIPWFQLGRKDVATALLGDRMRGGLWLGFRKSGVAFLRNARLQGSYAEREGIVNHLRLGPRGALWAATEGGLTRIKDGAVATLTQKRGLPCDSVQWSEEDDDGGVWLNMPCGLVRIAKSELDAWVADPNRTVSVTVLDNSEGVRSHSYANGFDPRVAKSADGRLWFFTVNGLSVLDPGHLQTNKVPPPVHIEQITADDKPYDMTHGMRLPARVRHLEVDYTALSLVAPEKVRFRIKLEGQDKDWRELTNVRHVEYTNLPPGNYRFRVKACNNSGVWNEEGATLDFVIPPMWYQTNWFIALCAVAFLAVLWAFYRMRVRQLRRREEKLRETIENIPAIAFMVGADGSGTFVNKRWVDYTGLDAEAASGAGWQRAVHPDDIKRVTEQWRSSTRKGQPLEYEARFRRGADGEYRWHLARAVPMHDKRGKIVKYYGVMADIEDRKRAQLLEAELAHTNRVTMLGELAASISHELKQPICASMTNARASLRWLKREQPNMEEAFKSIGRIVDDGARANEIIESLRSLYKKSPTICQLVDVNDIAREMVALLRSEATGRAVSIRTDLGDLPKIMADRIQVQQVLMNLMLNGIEAMNEMGGILTIKTQLDGGRVLISVSDTGVGLPADKANQIFDAFFTTKPQGSGMGLAICRSIVESHGGRIWATPNNGRGATLHFTLSTTTGASASGPN